MATDALDHGLGTLGTFCAQADWNMASDLLRSR